MEADGSENGVDGDEEDGRGSVHRKVCEGSRKVVISSQKCPNLYGE